MSNYRNQLEEYLKTLDIKADRVLDVGGAAKPVKGRVKSWDIKDYEILDLPEYDLNSADLFYSDFNRANIVFCLEVFEYIYNPFKAINNLNDLLKDNGILYITFPFIYPVHEPKQNDYLRYTCDGAAKLLGENGFKILDIIPRIMTPKGFDYWKEFMIIEGMHWSKHSRHDQLGFIIRAQKI